MSAEWENVNKGGGFSTLEMLIAFAILVLSVSSVMPIVFGNQSVSVDTRTNSEALYKAEQFLENGRANARLDFNLANPVGVTPDDIYQKTLDVQSTDLFMKRITSRVTWRTDALRTQSVTLTTAVSNWQNVDGGNTCSSVLAGDWQRPQMVSYDFGKDLLGDTASDFAINGVDAFNKRLYVAAGITHGGNPNTFFVFDLALNPLHPSLLYAIDNNPSAQAGLNALRAAGGYVYAANALGSNFDTCASGSCGQLQIIDVSSTPPQVKVTFKIPGVTGKSGQSIGKSIFYKGGYVYLGLAKTKAGPEFNVIDVHDPLVPVYKGGYSVGSGINAIYVRGRYAYLATSANEELTVLDLANPSSPTRIGGADLPDNSANGKSLAIVGGTLYLGRTVGISSGTKEFYILDVTNPAVTPLPTLGLLDMKDGGADTSLNGVAVRDYLAFFITNSQFQVWNISNPLSITQWTTPLSFPAQGGGGTSSGIALDCEANYIYVASLPSGNQKGTLSVVGPGP